MAGGGHETDKHYYDTIQNKRSVDELSKFLNHSEVEKLSQYSHGRPYAVWGAVPGVSNIRNWESMEEGDYVMVYRKGKIILAAEIAAKVRNPNLAEYLWKKDESGKTWEYTYFMINGVEFDIDISKINEYLGYESTYHPQGFMAIKQEKVDRMLAIYGDLISLLEKLQKGEKIEEFIIDQVTEKDYKELVDENIQKAPTEHSEMQWRLIRLGNKSKFDVWVPEGDRNRQWNGEVFNEMVIKDFHETIDVPIYIKNIDTVWKLGHSIKSAFEIENSTSIYSGILRLSDLKALAPNSNYPLFIVAQKEKKSRVFDQLRRPTFSNEHLALDKAIKFLSYDAIRELDENHKNDPLSFNIDWLLDKAESVP
jgi:hypothetical protein